MPRKLFVLFANLAVLFVYGFTFFQLPSTGLESKEIAKLLPGIIASAIGNLIAVNAALLQNINSKALKISVKATSVTEQLRLKLFVKNRNDQSLLIRDVRVFGFTQTVDEIETTSDDQENDGTPEVMPTSYMATIAPHSTGELLCNFVGLDEGQAIHEPKWLLASRLRITVTYSYSGSSQVQKKTKTIRNPFEE